ncbi:hypothetical protein QLQ15_14660 [Lysobacter sp. LF1]|uniref:Uncharacterized protein n=1 Tax=Lysobacter stagni TaxID=3045172 RepID=A0ABT6XJ40_9GAMM|nr:hypothetical protein [Lysobacter sp. LF1]MDI9240152.1 hypothetical protein [Lysobacter sp. LF1]
MAAKKPRSRATSETTLRHVWLAGLGLVAVSRRELLASPARLQARAAGLQGRVEELAQAARARVLGQVEPSVVRFSAEVEARLAPVLDKLGLGPKTRRPARKARKATKPQARRAARKPARRTARKGG